MWHWKKKPVDERIAHHLEQKQATKLMKRLGEGDGRTIAKLATVQALIQEKLAKIEQLQDLGYKDDAIKRHFAALEAYLKAEREAIQELDHDLSVELNSLKKTKKYLDSES